MTSGARQVANVVAVLLALALLIGCDGDEAGGGSPSVASSPSVDEADVRAGYLSVYRPAIDALDTAITTYQDVAVAGGDTAAAAADVATAATGVALVEPPGVPADLTDQATRLLQQVREVQAAFAAVAACGADVACAMEASERLATVTASYQEARGDLFGE